MGIRGFGAWAVVVASTLALAGCKDAEKKKDDSEESEKPKKPKSVLSKIEDFEAPKCPSSETYDNRKSSGAPNPATLKDTLIADVWQRIQMDLKKKDLAQDEVTEEIVADALAVYVDRDWEKIAGYRPWTHKHFVESLNKKDRKQLAKEIAASIKKDGVKDPNLKKG